MSVDLTFLRRGLLLFWAVWLTIVCSTNVCDGLKALRLLGDDWRFASGNFAYVVETTAHYQVPNWLNSVLFTGVILWEGTAALLYWRAWRLFHAPRAIALAARVVAFATSLGLWAAFIIAEELLIAYKVEAVHWRLFTANLATLLVMYLLPAEGPTSSAS